MRAGDDWELAGTLLDFDGDLLDLQGVTVEWRLLGADGAPVLGATGNMLVILGAGSIMITVPGAVTATLPPGRYLDALRATHEGLVSTLWIGTRSSSKPTPSRESHQALPGVK